MADKSWYMHTRNQKLQNRNILRYGEKTIPFTTIFTSTFIVHIYIISVVKSRITHTLKNIVYKKVYNVYWIHIFYTKINNEKDISWFMKTLIFGYKFEFEKFEN